MNDLDEIIRRLYLKDEYIDRHPSLHEEDTTWKVSKITPLVDRFISCINKDSISLLDIGGGTGLILNAVSKYIKETHSVEVGKFALDLSPGMLEIQKRRNPDLIQGLNEDIQQTSLSNKQIDLTLMIDVLEHIPHPPLVLKELRRISNFVILKVPLEDNFLLRVLNFLKAGKTRQRLVETVGHINIYNYINLINLIESYFGYVLDWYFTNQFDYVLHSEPHQSKMNVFIKLKNRIATYMYRLSPKLCAFIFGESIMILAQHYHIK